MSRAHLHTFSQVLIHNFKMKDRRTEGGKKGRRQWRRWEDDGREGITRLKHVLERMIHKQTNESFQRNESSSPH